MKATCAKVFVIIAALSLAMGVMAQPQGGPGGRQNRMGMGNRQMSNSFLLMRTDVQADLKLTTDQKTKLTAISENTRKQMQELFPRPGSGNTGNAGGGQVNWEENRKKMEKISVDADKSINEVLTKTQQTRLGQIAIQMQGAWALLNADNQKTLAFTTKQKNQAQDLSDNFREAGMALFQKMQDGEIDRDQMKTISDKNQKTLETSLTKLLTAEQKTKFDSMKGLPFKRDTKLDQGFGGGFGGPRMGGGNRGGNRGGGNGGGAMGSGN